MGAGAIFVALATWVAVDRGLKEARADPIVRRATIALPNWPEAAPPITVALLSDLHVGNAATTPARLARVVVLTNALHPDLVLIAGDFLDGRRPIPRDVSMRRLASLAGLKAPLGVVAVLGNHDYWTGEAAIRSDLAHLGVTLLSNQAMRVGPLAVGGVSDAMTHHNLDWRVYPKVRALTGAPVILTHAPEISPWMTPDMPLMLAGHTHCGQIRLPLIGSIDPIADFKGFRCGIVRRGNHLTIITAGIGTSLVPLRLGAPPDMWLLTLGPSALLPASRLTP